MLISRLRDAGVTCEAGLQVVVSWHPRRYPQHLGN